MSASELITPQNIGERLKEAFREANEQDRIFPKNKKVEVVFLVEAINAILPRTEGVEDITLIKLPGTSYEVPMILPEKLQAVSRRRMLAQLRRYRDVNASNLKSHLLKLAGLFKYTKGGRGRRGEEVKVGYKKAEIYKDKPEEWNCYIQPPGGDIREATDVGMDGFCPACTIFGTVLDSTKLEGIGNESIGLKSRVEFDPAITFIDQERSVAAYTHNKVADGASWTGQSLYTEHHVVPGTVFIGKVTLEDVTEVELKAFLAVLSAIDRLGGRERLFGGVRIHLVGVRGGSYETVTALEIARKLAREYGEVETMPVVEEVSEKVWSILDGLGFYKTSSKDFKMLLDDMSLWDKLWSDTVEYDKRVVERVLRLVKGDNFKEIEEG